MGKIYTQAQAKATAHYMQDKHTIRVVVKKRESRSIQRIGKRCRKKLESIYYRLHRKNTGIITSVFSIVLPV